MLTLLNFLILLVFLCGLYFYAKTADPQYYEGLTNNNGLRCPNILIQKGCYGWSRWLRGLRNDLRIRNKIEKSIMRKV